MSEEPLALSKLSPALPAQDEYETICTTLMHTERGRWFLQEYTRRNRSADTQVLLGALARIESVVRAERDRQAHQNLRSGLLEMAEAITRTQAEVAEIGSQTPPRVDPARPGSQVSADTPRSESADIFAAAERIRDVTWAMRGRGFDPSTCDQLEALAASILSASSLRDPNDRRVRKLSEVLQHLERRIDALLESCAEGASAPPTDGDDGKPAAAADAGSDPPAASASAAERSAPPCPAPDPSRDPAPWSAFPPADAEPMPPAIEHAEMLPDTPIAAPAGRDAAEARARTSDALLPAVELLDSGELLPKQPDAGPAPLAAAERIASAFLGAIDSRSDLWDLSEPPEADPQGTAASPPEAMAAEPPGAPAPAQSAAERIPQPPPNDPLAALKAMSDIERIALFT